MINRVFTVYDVKALAYLPPFHMRTKGEAIRAFSDECQKESSQFNKHPEDFILYEIGDFDDSQGQYKMHQEKIQLGLAKEFSVVSPSNLL